MKIKFKYILANFFSFISLFFLFLQPINAQIEFDTSSKIVYQVGPRGNGNVNQEINLTNNFSHIYPKEYQMQITGKEIQNITAEDAEGDILSSVSEKEDKTIINLKFNQISVGKNKNLNFFINYDLPNLATKRGQIWEMSIPRLANTEELANLELEVKVPVNFGRLTYSSVNPIKEEVVNNQLVLNFAKNQFNKNPILLAFGEFQTFNFDLDFTLTNDRGMERLQAIPIPPDTSYQSVFLTKINPKPIKIFTDEDFNWLAVYQLDPGEKIDINVKGQARIFSKPENEKFTQLYENKPLKAYLEDDLYWEVNSPIIQDLSKYFSTPKEIYDFIIENLEYNFEEIEQSQRLGAVKAYQQGGGVCTEFSDLFVTLARAINIPARELQGFAFTENKELFTLAAESDVLHSWVEYWDANNKVWVPSDPTWAKTTQGIDFINQFDLGHFAFVVHGHSSTKPVPPGFYKFNNNQSKSIKVEFAEKLITPPKKDIKTEIVNNNNNELIIKIKNKSLSPAYQTELISYGWSKKKQEELTIDFLPPLGEETINISRPSFWSRIFSNPTYEIVLDQQVYNLQYPRKKLNLFEFFANLLP